MYILRHYVLSVGHIATSAVSHMSSIVFEPQELELCFRFCHIFGELLGRSLLHNR